VPSHVADELAGGAQGAHDVVPQLLVLLLLTHTPAHRWKPALQLKPHETPSHVAVAFAGGAHGVHEAPHEAVLVLLEHAAPQVW